MDVSLIPLQHFLPWFSLFMRSYQHNVLYYATCPEIGCVEDYKGKTGRRLKQEGYKKSHLYKHLQETVCSYYVTYAFQSESTLYSCLNIKELLP